MGRNPFDRLLRDHENDLERVYKAARETRLGEQKELLIKVQAFNIDNYLQTCVASDTPPLDPRNSLIFIARPPQHLCKSIGNLQETIRKVFQSLGFQDTLWKTEANDLHMTLLDIASNKAASEIQTLAYKAEPHIDDILSSVKGCITLIEPAIMFDRNAIAITWIPIMEAGYSHLHLRRDLWESSAAVDLVPEMRYITFSAHCTIARFIGNGSGASGDAWQQYVERLSALPLNVPDKWIIEPSDVQCIYGTVWYGKGIVLQRSSASKR